MRMQVLPGCKQVLLTARPAPLHKFPYDIRAPAPKKGADRRQPVRRMAEKHSSEGVPRWGSRSHRRALDPEKRNIQRRRGHRGRTRDERRMCSELDRTSGCARSGLAGPR